MVKHILGLPVNLHLIDELGRHKVIDDRVRCPAFQ